MKETNVVPVFRHEWKHLITLEDLLVLRARLKAVAKADVHTVDGKYHMRSLYFDNYADRVLREKLDGISVREKYRIRYYNGDPSVMFLEKKCKQAGLGYKLQARLNTDQAGAIVLQCRNTDAEQQAVSYLSQHTKKMVDKSKTARAGYIELNYEVRLRDEQTGFITELSELNGVESAVLVSYNGDYLS